MKSLIKKLVKSLVRNECIWTVLNKTIIPFAYYAKISREPPSRQNADQTTQEVVINNNIFSGMTVMHGVFAGMKYPEMTSVGSSLLPKLLGSYERELEPALQQICSQDYSEIVDIGCAEGYYAVGLAMRIKNAKVFAFDSNETAIRLCNMMAEVNGVSDRVTVGAFCDGETLRSLSLGERVLLICDCEGYEKQLFNSANVAAFSRYEFLIETHDFIDIEISSYLRDLFVLTHNIKTYRSIDDITKTFQYSYKELEGLPLKTRKQILQEKRPAIMEWFHMTPKQKK